MNEIFRKIATRISQTTGSAKTFIFALIVIITWALSGSFFNYSDTWQLVINTTTTVVTFLMVFIIQNTQNRDSKAVHLKLDELIKSIRGARNKLLDSENLSDEDLEKLHQEYERLHQKYEAAIRNRKQREKKSH